MTDEPTEDLPNQDAGPSRRKERRKKRRRTDDPIPKPVRVAPRVGFGARIRAYFFAGILITAPVAITFYLAWLVITFIDSKVTALIPARYNPETYLPFALPGLGVVIIVAVLILIGFFAAGFIGRLLIRMYEGILARMPVIRNIYSAIKQIIETILAQQSAAFRQAVLVEYPRRGLWAIAFITGRTEGEVQNLTDEEVVNIFLPTTPNPTSGFLLFVPRKDMIPLSMTVEEAIKMVISGGIVTPPDRRPEEERAEPQIAVRSHEEVDILRERDGVTVLISRPAPDDG
jgi:uncharacterized membrane protein